MKRAGFDVRGAADVKALVERRGYFTETQAALLGEILSESERSDAEARSIATKAARHFGTTNNFKLAGYLTINGSLLDFSEGQRSRTRDHREISEILELPDGAGYSDGMIAFMNQGNIRLQSYGIDIASAPNPKQTPILRRFFQSLNGEVVVDFSAENGDNLEGCR